MIWLLLAIPVVLALLVIAALLGFFAGLTITRRLINLCIDFANEAKDPELLEIARNLHGVGSRFELLAEMRRARELTRTRESDDE